MEWLKSFFFFTSKSKVDVIIKVIGCGKYQILLCLLVFLSKFFIAFHQLAIVFLAPKVSYICGEGVSMTCPCDNPIYNRSIFTNTIVMEWNLICSRNWMISLAQTIFQAGTLIGSILFGMAADRFGRKHPLRFAVFIQMVTSIGSAFTKNYWIFFVLRFLIGISVGGTMVCGFVAIMEVIASKHRDFTSAIYQVPFNLGHLLLPFISYNLRDYFDFQLAISAPTLIMLIYFCMLPESPRWLVAVKRTDEAIVLLERIAAINNRPTENIRSEIIAYQSAISRNQLKKGTILDLFRTPNIRKNIIAMSLNWLSCSYCFYGVSQYVGHLTGNLFLNVAASAGVALLGTLFSIPLMKMIGRRTILIICNFICAACLFGLAAVHDGEFAIVLACVGVITSFIIFVVVYLYCSELFPTVVRNAALGFSSMMARVGSMVAPFIIDLKQFGAWMPPVGFAVVPLVATFVSFLLPETKGCELTNTIEEAEAFGKKKKPGT